MKVKTTQASISVALRYSHTQCAKSSTTPFFSRGDRGHEAFHVFRIGTLVFNLTQIDRLRNHFEQESTINQRILSPYQSTVPSPLV